jgi:hypothetical protein
MTKFETAKMGDGHALATCNGAAALHYGHRQAAGLH